MVQLANFVEIWNQESNIYLDYLLAFALNNGQLSSVELCFVRLSILCEWGYVAVVDE